LAETQLRALLRSNVGEALTPCRPFVLWHFAARRMSIQ